jgi:hypothetical protein
LSRKVRFENVPAVHVSWPDGDLNLWAPTADLPTQEPSEEAIMAQWHDEMVDRPQADSAAYATGWTISGLTLIGVIVAVWVLGI